MSWKKLTCDFCKKFTTAPVPDTLIVRAFMVCPECLSLLGTDAYDKWQAAVQEDAKKAVWVPSEKPAESAAEVKDECV